MPGVSQKQFKFFQMLAHDPKKAKKHGMGPAKAKEYISNNKGPMTYKNLPEKKK